MTPSPSTDSALTLVAFPLALAVAGRPVRWSAAGPSSAER